MVAVLFIEENKSLRELVEERLKGNRIMLGEGEPVPFCPEGIEVYSVATLAAAIEEASRRSFKVILRGSATDQGTPELEEDMIRLAPADARGLSVEGALLAVYKQLNPTG